MIDTPSVFRILLNSSRLDFLTSKRTLLIGSGTHCACIRARQGRCCFRVSEERSEHRFDKKSSMKRVVIQHSSAGRASTWNFLIKCESRWKGPEQLYVVESSFNKGGKN